MGACVGFLIGRAGQIINPERARSVPTLDQKRANTACSQILSHEVSKCKWRGGFVQTARPASFSRSGDRQVGDVHFEIDSSRIDAGNMHDKSKRI